MTHIYIFCKTVSNSEVSNIVKWLKLGMQVIKTQTKMFSSA